MNLDALSRPLSINEIEFRVQSVNNGGYATILAYKDARIDMSRLDEAFGCLGWQRSHEKGNQNCVVSAYDPETKEWVGKEDTGSESQAEAKKGLASDSFKRACFNWGIGRELYSFPVIQVKLFDSELSKGKANYNFKLKKWTWFLQRDSESGLNYLAAKDDNGKKRFEFGKFIKND